MPVDSISRYLFMACPSSLRILCSSPALLGSFNKLVYQNVIVMSHEGSEATGPNGQFPSHQVEHGSVIVLDSTRCLECYIKCNQNMTLLKSLFRIYVLRRGS
jgi:hypothetical protein